MAVIHRQTSAPNPSPQGLLRIKYQVEQALELIVASEYQYVVEADMFSDCLRLWSRNNQTLQASNDLLLTRFEIDQGSYVELALKRAAIFLHLKGDGRATAIADSAIDPILEDLMEGRGLADFMEDANG